jgi:ATP-dependent RNA helicase RhlE
MPDTADAYTHRIGRTGRAEKTGEAFTFMTSEDKGMVRTIEHSLGKALDRKTLSGFDYEKREAGPIRAAGPGQPRPARLRGSRPENKAHGSRMIR